MKNIWISLLALVLSIIALIITFIRIDVTISNDTFIGIIASFIGACSTILVGCQIYSMIETSRKIVGIDKKMNMLESSISDFNEKVKEFEYKNNKFETNLSNVYGGLNYSQGLFSVMNKQYFCAYKDFINSIDLALKCGNEELVNTSLNMMGMILDEIEKNIENINIDYDIDSKSNRYLLQILYSNPNYEKIQEVFEEKEHRRRLILDKIKKQEQ